MRLFTLHFLTLSIVASLMLFSNLLFATQHLAYATRLVARDNISWTDTAYFGVTNNPNSTYCIDNINDNGLFTDTLSIPQFSAVAWETELPPPPPNVGIFDFRFIDSRSESGQCLGAGENDNFHAGSLVASTDTFEIYYQVNYVGELPSPLHLSWTLPDTAILGITKFEISYLSYDEGRITVDMMKTSSLDIISSVWNTAKIICTTFIKDPNPKFFTMTTSSINGSILRDRDFPQYDSNTVVRLTAVPDSGYHFVCWSGDDSCSTNPLLVKMNSSKNFTAVFALNEFSINVDDRWNIISIPFQTSSATKTLLFPTAVTNVFVYNGSYVPVETLCAGKGYWTKFDGSQKIIQTGCEPLRSVTIDVVNGWNLIGSLSSPIPVSSITSVPPGIVTSEFFEHKDKYESVDIIEPGHGYWVNASSAGQLILSLTDTLSAMNRIRIEPMVEAPPSAPVSDAGTELPQTFSLQQNYPNPFNPTTIISYSLPTSVYVTLKVYDVLGKEVATLVNGTQDAGIKSVNFNTASISGGLPSGMYIYKLNAGTYSAVKKLLLMK